MTIKVGYSSPYSRMSDLAIEISCKQLRVRKLETTLNELYPDGKIPDYSTLVQTLLDSLKKDVYQAFSQDECLQRLLPKLKGRPLDQCADIYGGGIDNIRHIERALSKLNIHRPPRPLAQNAWCVIC